jgi:hypothetical protein
MNINSNAAESKSAAQKRDAERASVYGYSSTVFERILFCDTKGESC